MRTSTWTAACFGAILAVIFPVQAQRTGGECRIDGRTASGSTPLPGVSLVLRAGESIVAATSSDVDGGFQLQVPAGAYRVTAELTGFVAVARDVVAGGQPCGQSLDLQMSLTPRAPPSGASLPQPAAAPGAPVQPQRFETLAVQELAAASASDANASREPEDTAAALLLPPGFSGEGPTEAVAINGAMASVDRGLMLERVGAIGRGEFDPLTGELAPGFGPAGGQGPGGRGGPAGGGRGGPGGGRGEFVIGGRGGRQNTFSGTPRVQAAASDVARGTNGTLRADYDGGPIAIPDPTIDRFFNTAAFSVPAPGTFGTASRNMIIGPGSRLLDAQLTRDVRLGGPRVVSLQIDASNLLNLVNTRGLQAVVPGGDARRASGRGESLFSGRGVAQQFAQLAGSQDTLTSLAGDTGGRAFTDTNEFGDAFARVQRDMSAYYLLGYSSTNPARDGRFRRVQVRVRRDGLRVEARAGYYAPRDFAHTSRTDRDAQLEEQLFAAVSATDLPVLVTGGWFRLAADRYYVPIAVAVPGSAVPVAAGRDKAALDVMGLVRDEQGRPVGRFRQTMEVPAGSGATLAGKQVLYQSGVTLPPGRFGVKVVVRENATGLTGSFESAVVVPELKQAPVNVSSVVLSTQIQPARGGRSDNPLVRDGVQLLPNLTHIVGREQKMLFYYEVYDAAVEGSAVELRTSLAFYRGKVKVMETPVVERRTIDVPDRRASVFRLEVPANAFRPGVYICQVNIIDAVSGRFAFPRLTLAVR